MIRFACPADIEEVLALGIEFAEKSKPVHGFEVSAEVIRHTIIAVLGNPDAVFLVSQIAGKIEGVMLGVIANPYFSTDRVLQALSFYVRNGREGLKLLDAFEVEGKAKGATRFVVGCKPAFCDLRKLYERRGYRLLEEQFMKVEV